jgi:hypothetical protein
MSRHGKPAAAAAGVFSQLLSRKPMVVAVFSAVD